MKKPECPPRFDKTTVNEVISLLSENDEVKKYIKNANDEYFSWDELKRQPLPEGTDLNSLWHLVKLTRESSSTTIKNFNKFNTQDLLFKFNVNISNTLQKKIHEIDLNCGGVLVSSNITPLIPKEDEKMYLLSSIMEEAIASSQLEGATTTRSIAKEMLKTKRAPRDSAERMILNNYITLTRIIEIKDEKITPQLIKTIQATITKDTLEKEEWSGRFRNNNDVRVHDKLTNEIFHTPPSFDKIGPLIDAFCEYANSTEIDFIHPIVKASILHFLIGYIHPFEDGNGRTARAIFYWYLISKNYWLFRYMSISRVIINSPAKYTRAYLDTEQDDNDLTYFIKFQIKCVESARKELKEYIIKKQEEKNKIYDFLNKIPSINDRQALVLSLFSKNPKRIVTIQELKERFGIVYQTARTDLLELVNKKFLIKKKTGKKYTFFRSENFDTIMSKLI
jgi:Fic family protein